METTVKALFNELAKQKDNKNIRLVEVPKTLKVHVTTPMDTVAAFEIQKVNDNNGFRVCMFEGYQKQLRRGRAWRGVRGDAVATVFEPKQKTVVKTKPKTTTTKPKTTEKKVETKK